MRERFIVIVFLLLAIVPATAADDVEKVIGRPSGPALRGVELDHRTAQVATLLRCPTCQGLSVLDSNAPMAVNMKGQVRDLLARGYDRDQILGYFRHSYGDFVLLDPPKKGINWIVWLAPLAALIVGGVLIRSMTKRNLATVMAPDDGLEPFLDRVRVIAYGPSGRDGGK